jgi:hypothetical protein
MAHRGSPLTAAIVLLAVVAALMIGYLVLHRRDQSKYLASAEYWVYLPGDKMPSQDAMLTRMVGKNPYSQRGQSPIGQSEGIILSDIRLHIALILRSKNPHVFRPDLFDNIAIDAEQLAALSESHSIVKLRYISELLLSDKRHLQFLIHAADAMAEIGNSRLIYDTVAQRIFTKEELAKELAESVDATRSSLHVRTLWKGTADERHAETLGLKKMGLEELRTGPMEADEQVLIDHVLEPAIEHIWLANRVPTELEVEAFDDPFKVLFTPKKDGFVDVRILRIQNL